MRRQLLIFYAQGVKANALFFDAKPAQEAPWTTRLWVYDLRTNMHFTLKTNPLKRSDPDEFVACFNENRHKRKEGPADGRWRSFSYNELLKRDKLNLDIFWLKDKSLEERSTDCARAVCGNSCRAETVTGSPPSRGRRG